MGSQRAVHHRPSASTAPPSVIEDHLVAGRELSVRKSATEVRKEGWLYRESGYVNGLVNPRYGAIYPHALVTFREQSADMPTKVWPLHPLCKLSDVTGDKFAVRGKHSNILVALATQHVKKKPLMYFTIDWPHNHIFGAEHLKLAFEDASEAESWHRHLERAIGELATAPDPAAGGQLRSAVAGVPRTGSFQRLRRHMTPDRGNNSGRGLTRRFSSDSQSLSHFDSTADEFTRREHSAAGGVDRASVGDPGHLTPPRVTDSSEQAPSAPPAEEQRRWCSFWHVNGVAVFREETDANGTGGAMMVSTIVRAAPKAVYKALMDLSPDNHFMSPFFSACLLEQKDHGTRIVKGWLQSQGLASSICAPREAVIEQISRKEDDGTFIVLMQSTEHPKAPLPAGPWWQWFTPVRAEVEACGYTIAPLQARYQAAGLSSECLVTMVLKLNPGGWLGPIRRLGLLSERSVLNNFVEPLLLSVTTLRDKVEQERFVVKPFTLGLHSSPAHDDHAAAEDGAEASDKLLNRSTTGLIRGGYGGANGDANVGSKSLRRSSVFLPSKAIQESYTERRVLPSSAEQREASQLYGAVVDETFPHGTLDAKYWSFPGVTGLKVRGANYLQNRKKVLSEEPLFALNAADLTESEEKVWNIGRFLPSIRNNRAPFTLVLNLIVPGPPWRNLVMSWAADYSPSSSSGGSHSRGQTPKTSVAGSVVDGGQTARSTHAPSTANGSVDEGSDSEVDQMSPFDVSMARFLCDGPDSQRERDARFKLIPSVIHASWIIKQAVGTTPVLLGNKLVTRYFREETYFEIDVDIGSSYAASSVVNLVKGATKSMVIDFGVLVEGKAEDELPERLIGTCRFSHLDMDSGMYLDPEGRLHHKSDVDPAARRAAAANVLRRTSKLKVP